MKKKPDHDVGNRPGPRTKLSCLRAGCMFLILSVISVAPLFSQVKVTVSMTNASLEEFFEEVGRRTGYDFTYGSNVLQGTGRHNIEFRDSDLSDVLREFLGGRGLDFRIEEKMVFVTRAQRAVRDESQQITVTGQVHDRSGNPLPGVAVLLKGTVRGISTDISGRYTLTFPSSAVSGDPVLEFRLLGHFPAEVTVRKGSSSPVNVVLDEDSTEVGDVIVTGVFNRSRESFTGAVRTITSADLKAAGQRSLLTSIANVDPSFKIATDLNIGSDPNALPSITMRGNSGITTSVRDLQSDNQMNPNQPLFIMDGFEISLQTMMDLDENQIETVTLLKDASATAMYGTRGSNGVVVIKTRPPVPGELRITYQGTLNIEAPDLTSYNLMNSFEKLQFEQETGMYKGANTHDSQLLYEVYNARLMDAARGVDTYWLKYPVRTGVGHSHHVSLEGGSEEFRFKLNLGYKGNEGTMKGSASRTTNGGITLLYALGKFTFTNNLQLDLSNKPNSPYGSFSQYGGINPYYAPYDENGNVIKTLESYYYRNTWNTADVSTTSNTPNPLWNARLESIDKSKYKDIRNTFSMQWNILPELFVRAAFGYSTNNTRTDLYKSKDHTDFANYSDLGRRGTYSQTYYERDSYTGTVTLNYSKMFNGVHNVFAGLSYDVAHEKYESYTFEAEGISNPSMDFMAMAAAYKQNGAPGGYDGIARRVGGRANLNYTYGGRYYIDVVGSLEGSSKFGSDNRTAPFWSSGIGWNLHNEKFLAENRVIDYLKLRFSYGTTGSQNFSPYQAMRTYKDFGSTTYRIWSGAYIMALGNDELGWQKSREMNLGTEIEILDKRIGLIFNVYRNMTDDLLTDVNIPTSSGFSSYVANVGKVENKGIDADLYGYLIKKTHQGIYWRVGINFQTNRNTIKEISNSLQFLNDELLGRSSVNPSFLFEEGQSINTIFVVPSLGIDPGNGNEMYVKRDGTVTYEWDSRDQVACGVQEEKWWGNIYTSFRYRGLTFNAVFRYGGGGQMYNSTLANKVENINPFYNADKRALYDRWSRPGDKVMFKRIDDLSQTKNTSRFVMDYNYFSLSSVTLSYDIDSPWLHKAGLRYMTVNASTEELFVASSIRQERGLSYPFSRKFTVGLILRF